MVGGMVGNDLFQESGGVGVRSSSSLIGSSKGWSALAVDGSLAERVD